LGHEFDADEKYDSDDEYLSEDELVVEEEVFHPAVEDESNEEQCKEGTHIEKEQSRASEDAPASPDQPDTSVSPSVATDGGNKGNKPVGSHTASSESSKKSSCSIAHEFLAQKKVVYFSLDVETGGPECGILQISIVAASADGDILDTYNEYVKPPDSAIWDPKAQEVSGLHNNLPFIRSAKPIEEVWPSFKAFIENQLNRADMKGIMVAWNGASCDMDYIFHVTEISHKGKLEMPRGIDFFLDPCRVISHYTSCKLHETKRKQDGHSLSKIWCYIKRQEAMEGAHDSLVDARAQRDVLFHPEKGWSRRATRKYTFNRNDIPSFTAQATTWKDKKQIGVLHNHLVEPTGDFTVLRYNKATRKSEPVPAPRILHDYAHHMGGIDHIDRDTADYSVSLKSERFYLRIFYWILNAVIHCNYVIVTLVSKEGGPKHDEWSQYRNVHDGRFKYQIDLSQQLIEYGIRMDWINVEDDSQRPEWVRQGNFIPCNCKTCFFCKTGKTTGIMHRPATGPPQETKGCSSTREHLHDYSVKCRSCYARHREEHPNLSKKEIKRLCHDSSMGCRNCGGDKGAAICKWCWPTYQHDIRD
jgi:hypothetical protein